MADEHGVGYHSSSSGLTTRVQYLIFCKLLWAYLTMIGRIFQIYGAQISGNCICKSRNYIQTYLLVSPFPAPKQNLPSGSLSHLQTEFLFLPKQGFFETTEKAHRHVQNPVKYLGWTFFVKINNVNYFHRTLYLKMFHRVLNLSLVQVFKQIQIPCHSILSLLRL